MEAVLNGKVGNEWWCLPLFLFDEDLVQPEQPTAGIFQGYVLVRVSFYCSVQCSFFEIAISSSATYSLGTVSLNGKARPMAVIRSQQDMG